MALRYWCHSCTISRDTKVDNDIRLCSTCNSEFVELLEHESVNRVQEIRVMGEPEGSEISNAIFEFIRAMEDRHIMQLREQDSISTLTSQTFEEDQSKELIVPLQKKYRESLYETMLSDKELNEICHICHDDFKHNLKAIRLECGHFYHKDCIDSWFDKKYTCPVCRHQFPAESSDEE